MDNVHEGETMKWDMKSLFTGFIFAIIMLMTVFGALALTTTTTTDGNTRTVTLEVTEDSWDTFKADLIYYRPGYYKDLLVENGLCEEEQTISECTTDNREDQFLKYAIEENLKNFHRKVREGAEKKRNPVNNYNLE